MNDAKDIGVAPSRSIICAQTQNLSLLGCV